MSGNIDFSPLTKVTPAPRISKAQGRSVVEWIGPTNDSMPPPHVRLRVFDRHEGRCHITGIKIEAGDKWDLEHIIRLEDGGGNRESNLAPALRTAHRVKTAEETKRGKDADRARLRHAGIVRPKQTIKSRGFSPPANHGPKIPKQPVPDRRPLFLATQPAPQSRVYCNENHA